MRALVFALFLLIATVFPVTAQTADKPQAQGTLENGTYRNTHAGIQFTLPPDWVLVSEDLAASGAQTVTIRDTVSNVIALVWMKARHARPDDIPASMASRLDSKAAQRNNFPGYTYRTESVQHTTINGRPALSALADYVRTGQKMVEYLTWIDGENSRAIFTARMPEPALTNFQARFDAVVQSAVVP